jgi:hypothetical protein
MWAPVLFGSARVGATVQCLAAFHGAMSITYAWQDNGQAIQGATRPSFKIPASLLHQKLSCSVKATNATGSVTGVSDQETVHRGRHHAADDQVISPAAAFGRVNGVAKASPMIT